MKLNELASKWLKLAKREYKITKHLIEEIYPKELEVGGYFCWQSAEKAFKAYLIYNEITPPYVHDLRNL
jgi:HEPN domain-containing protein